MLSSLNNSFSTKRIGKAFKNSKKISFRDHEKIVIMSDCHRGNGTWADNFINNRPVYSAALQYYLSNNYTYIELGDGDELWENRSFKSIYNAHREIFDLLYGFHNKGKLIMVYGNHDRVKENNKNFWKGTGISIPFYESVVLTSELIPPIHMFHGYQGDLINDRMWKVSRSLVRYLWKPLELRGVKDPTSAAKNYTKGKRRESALIHYSCIENIILIAGHTHKPTLMSNHCGMYFNCGSCIHPYAITAIELTEKEATLVKWSVCAKPDLTLSVCRERLNRLKLTDFNK